MLGLIRSGRFRRRTRPSIGCTEKPMSCHPGWWRRSSARTNAAAGWWRWAPLRYASSRPAPRTREPSVPARVEAGARRGRLQTAHGVIETPAFMPVGTQASVKALSPDDLATLGVQVLLGNTYHLALRPGADRIARLGGLHRFMGWTGAILTDSGGFQVFSLDHLVRVSDEGAT